MLLDHGVPVHTFAEWLGHDAKTPLAHYARRTKRSGANAAAIIGGVLAAALGNLEQN